MKNKILIIFSVLLMASACVKDNFPVDIQEKKEYGSLYLQSTQGNSLFGLTYNLVPSDTILQSMTVNLGGGAVAQKDIPVTVTVMPELVDTYNAGKVASMRATLLPEGTYTLENQAVLPVGTSHTPFIPLTIDIAQLDPNGLYVLPVEFTAAETDYPVDAQRKTAYLTFQVRPSTKGVWIGNIPELVDDLLTHTDNTRPQITDFFGDLIVKDRLGNLIIYPLESNSDTNRLGPPDTVVKARVRAEFAGVSHLFFNDALNELNGTPFTGTYYRVMAHWPVTPRTQTKSATVAVMKNYDYNANYRLYYAWWMGYDGWKHFTTAGGGGRAYGVNPATPTTFTQMTPGISETNYRCWTAADDAHITNHADGLRIWGAKPNPLSLNNHTITSGKNFFTTYAKFASIKKRDFIGIRNNGDIILWKRFNRMLWYDGNDYIRPAQ